MTVSQRVSQASFYGKSLFLLYLFNGKIDNMRLNLALAQISTRLGDVEANLEKHLDFIEKARQQKADLIVLGADPLAAAGHERDLAAQHLLDLAAHVLVAGVDDRKVEAGAEPRPWLRGAQELGDRGSVK